MSDLNRDSASQMLCVAITLHSLLCSFLMCLGELEGKSWKECFLFPMCKLYHRKKVLSRGFSKVFQKFFKSFLEKWKIFGRGEKGEIREI